MQIDRTWQRALNLKERISLQGCVTPESLVEEGHRKEEGASGRFIRKWKSQSPFDQEEWFGNLLSQLGVREAVFIALSSGRFEAESSLLTKWAECVIPAAEEENLVLDRIYANCDLRLGGFDVIVLPFVAERCFEYPPLSTS